MIALDALPTIGGLPLHPLVVHAAVVLLPLAALSFLMVAFVPKLRTRYGEVVLGAAVLAGGAGLLAKESGETLAEAVGLPSAHADWGDLAGVAGLGLAAAVLVCYVVERRSARRVGPDATPPLVWAVRVATALVAVATLTLTVLAGHSGAQAVWAGRGQAPASQTSVKPGAVTSSAPRTTSPASTSSAVPGATATSSTRTPTAAASPALTLAEVGKHNDATSCWAVVNGNVYDLTRWISQHPGGPDLILQVCGTDASSQFNAQHAGQPAPNGELAQFLLGKLQG